MATNARPAPRNQPLQQTVDSFFKDLSPLEIAIGVSGSVALIGYIIFILAPSWASYGRVWERIAAGFLSLFILATVLGIGIGVGIGVIAIYLEVQS